MQLALTVLLSVLVAAEAVAGVLFLVDELGRQLESQPSTLLAIALVSQLQRSQQLQKQDFHLRSISN